MMISFYWMLNSSLLIKTHQLGEMYLNLIDKSQCKLKLPHAYVITHSTFTSAQGDQLISACSLRDEPFRKRKLYYLDPKGNIKYLLLVLQQHKHKITDYFLNI